MATKKQMEDWTPMQRIRHWVARGCLSQAIKSKMFQSDLGCVLTLAEQYHMNATRTDDKNQHSPTD